VAGGVAVSSAHASGSFEVTYEDGQYVLHNTSGHAVYIDDIEADNDGDLQPEYHAFIYCLSNGMDENGGECPMFLDGTHGTLEIYSNDLPSSPEAVYVSNGS
jgi:hypothetical protein